MARYFFNSRDSSGFTVVVVDNGFTTITEDFVGLENSKFTSACVARTAFTCIFFIFLRLSYAGGSYQFLSWSSKDETKAEESKECR